MYDDLPKIDGGPALAEALLGLMQREKVGSLQCAFSCSALFASPPLCVALFLFFRHERSLLSRRLAPLRPTLQAVSNPRPSHSALCPPTCDLPCSYSQLARVVSAKKQKQIDVLYPGLDDATTYFADHRELLESSGALVLLPPSDAVHTVRD